MHWEEYWEGRLARGILQSFLCLGPDTLSLQIQTVDFQRKENFVQIFYIKYGSLFTNRLLTHFYNIMHYGKAERYQKLFFYQMLYDSHNENTQGKSNKIQKREVP